MCMKMAREESSTSIISAAPDPKLVTEVVEIPEPRNPDARLLLPAARGAPATPCGARRRFQRR